MSRTSNGTIQERTTESYGVEWGIEQLTRVLWKLAFPADYHEVIRPSGIGCPVLLLLKSTHQRSSTAVPESFHIFKPGLPQPFCLIL